jgi:hypothetical protein
MLTCSIKSCLDIISVVGVLISILGIFISILIYKRQDDAQNAINESNEQSFNHLKKYSQLSFELLVDLKNDTYRMLSENGTDSAKNYWKFIWRFETWNKLGLIVFNANNEQKLVRVEILGKTKDFRQKEMENIDYEFYICKVIESNFDDYNVNDIVSCFYSDESSYISKNISNASIPEEKHKMYVGFLGMTDVQWVNETPASSAGYFKRAKDFKISEVE